MSLESNLELNNKLLTQQNELQAQNIALLERLIRSLSAGVALHADTVAQVQEYREPVSEKQKVVAANPDLDSLEFSDVIALASFCPDQEEPSAEMLQRATGYRDAVGDERDNRIDALDSALIGVKRAKALHKPVLLELARSVLAFWDELPGITERRDFAEKWLDAGQEDRPGLKPSPQKRQQNKEPERKGPFFYKNTDGKFGEVMQLRKLNDLIEKGCVEIHKLEYQQLMKAYEDKQKAAAEEETADDTPDYAAQRKQAEGLILQLAKGGYRNEAVAILGKFGASKLTAVPDDKLTEVIALAEKELEG